MIVSCCPIILKTGPHPHETPQLSSLSNIVPMKPWLARCAFLLRLFLISSFLTLRGSSAEVDRIGIVSAFDPELTAIEQAIIPQRAQSKIEEGNEKRVRLVDLERDDHDCFVSRR